MPNDLSLDNAASTARRLTPAEAEAIVAVRGLLDEAIVRAGDSSVVGRRVAAVLMDGAAEAAMAVGLAQFDDAPTRTTNFDELHRRLMEHLREVGHLKANEGLDGWADVKRLRQVRNNAQHQQIPPDHQTLVSWTGAVRRFVAHVVATSYQVELSTISAAAAIEHEELRGRFIEAEDAQAAGDTRTVIGQLSTVFDMARRLWDSQRRTATGESSSRPIGDERALSKFINEATRHLDETLTVAPFALDLGEYFWWRKLLRDAQGNYVEITAADAARAVAFVFNWIIRWESFSARYLDRVRLPRDPPENPPPSRTPDGTAELDGDREPVVEMRSNRASLYSQPVESWVFRVPYRNGFPGDEDRHPNYYLERELWSMDPRPPWKGSASHRGSYIEVSIDPAEFDPDVVLDELESRFKRAVARQAEEALEIQTVRAERQRLEDAVAAVAPDVLTIQLGGEQPFGEVTLVFRNPETYVLLHFTESFADALRAELLDARTGSNRLPLLPAPARMRYDGISCSTECLDDLVSLATDSLAVIDDKRRRIRHDQAESLRLEETLDTAAKESMKRRCDRQTTET